MRYFHGRKGCHKLDKMLYNLYKPIIWKALTVRIQTLKCVHTSILVFNSSLTCLCLFIQAPNFEVRANATLLFGEAFPVLDPDENNENIDETIQKQLDTAMVRTIQTIQPLFIMSWRNWNRHLSIIVRASSKTLNPPCAPMPFWESVRSWPSAGSFSLLQ